MTDEPTVVTHSTPVAEASMEQPRWTRAQQLESEFWRRRQTFLTREGFRKPFWKWPLRLLAQKIGLKDYNQWPIGDCANTWWEKQFDDYRAIPQQLGNVLELGCGPHTNFRLIREGRQIGRAFLSDPLVADYLKLERTWLRWAVLRGNACLDDHPIEECPFATDYFDLTVMINVLDHVRDPDLCLREVIRVTKPGGYYIVGEDLSTEDSVNNLPEAFREMHPVHATREHLDSVLLPACEPVLYRVLDQQHCRAPEIHAGTYLLIGQKK